MFMRLTMAVVYIENNLEYEDYKHNFNGSCRLDRGWIGNDRSFEGPPFWSRKTSFRVKCIANIFWRGKNEQPTIYLKHRGSERSARQQRNRIICK